MEKYQNKYRIASARAQWWNYGWNGAYFVTICTQNREHFFGKIVETQFIASQIGQIAETIWHEIPNYSPFVELGDFVVMPNHIHGILILNKPDVSAGTVETLHATSLRRATSLTRQTGLPKNQKMSAISPKSNTISTIIRSYKSAVTKHANRLGLKHGWQVRFRDRIIRDDGEYQRISDYIINNPSNWKDDQFY